MLAVASAPTFTVKVGSVLTKLNVVEAEVPVCTAVICWSVESSDFCSAVLIASSAVLRLVVLAADRFTVRLC